MAKNPDKGKGPCRGGKKKSTLEKDPQNVARRQTVLKEIETNKAARKARALARSQERKRLNRIKQEKMQADAAARRAAAADKPKSEPKPKTETKPVPLSKSTEGIIAERLKRSKPQTTTAVAAALEDAAEQKIDGATIKAAIENNRSLTAKQMVGTAIFNPDKGYPQLSMRDDGVYVLKTGAANNRTVKMLGRDPIRAQAALNVAINHYTRLIEARAERKQSR